LASNPQGDAFPLTRHSVVAAAQGRDPEERSRAMDAITNSYWRPVYKYVRLRWRVEREDAEDFTQDFFFRLLEKEFLASYDPAKGKLRTFLRTCIDRLFMNQLRDAHRQKRGDAAVHISLDFEEAEHELAASTQNGRRKIILKKSGYGLCLPWPWSACACNASRLARQRNLQCSSAMTWAMKTLDHPTPLWPNNLASRRQT
jgi:RNA polymerase sigma factor (sigma-70 family)